MGLSQKVVIAGLTRNPLKKGLLIFRGIAGQARNDGCA